MSDDKTPTDLTAIAGLKQRNEQAESLRLLRGNVPGMIEFYQIDAKIKRAHFLALLEAGFTEAQSLEICSRKA